MSGSFANSLGINSNLNETFFLFTKIGDKVYEHEFRASSILSAGPVK